MITDVVAPVKGITRAFDNGIKLAKRVSRSANSAPAEKALQISESAQSLQKSLERNSQAVNDAYEQGVAAFGKGFSNALVQDNSIQGKLKDLRIDLSDPIDDCPSFEEDLESFDHRAFTEIQQQSQRCCAETITIFHNLQDQLLQASLQNFKLNDRANLSSMKQAFPPSKPMPAAPSDVNKSSLILETKSHEPPKPRSPWSIDSPALFDTGISLSTSPRPISQDMSPLNPPTLSLVPKEVIDYRLNANEEFLERRRQSRIAFQNQMRQSSISSVSEYRVSDMSMITTPILGSSMTSSSSIGAPGSTASASGFMSLITRQRSPEHLPQATRTSLTSLLREEIPELPERPTRQDSTQSQESIFGLRAAPLSPTLSEHRNSGAENLATTLQVPGFGSGVEEGLEVLSHVDHDNGLMLVCEDEIIDQPTPITSTKSIGYPIRHDTSFYRFGGFCDGARALIAGNTGFKIVKRPTGHYSATVSARCIKCSYEVGYKEVEKDENLDRTGIYGNCGIRFRQRFISKCHLKASSVDEPVYACIFCIEEHKTVEEHDATVFFSVAQLFVHLAKHPRPLPDVAGITTIYGFQPPTIVDFDVHFTQPNPMPSQYSMAEIAAKVATRPSAHAVVTHHPKNTRSSSTDPEGNPSLHFGVGARIVGITFPDKFGGAWCIGYHDGRRGSFPAGSILLELPLRQDVLMNTKSSLVAFAKWDFKPKDPKDGGWLQFKKGEKISNIGYTFQDQWCWSGQSSKGKWGLFPASFVMNLQESGASLATSPGSTRSGGLLGRRMPTFPLRRTSTSTSSKNERVASARSNGSVVSMIGGRTTNIQPGLEVVQGANLNSL